MVEELDWEVVGSRRISGNNSLLQSMHIYRLSMGSFRLVQKLEVQSAVGIHVHIGKDRTVAVLALDMGGYTLMPLFVNFVKSIHLGGGYPPPPPSVLIWQKGASNVHLDVWASFVRTCICLGPVDVASVIIVSSLCPLKVYTNDNDKCF